MMIRLKEKLMSTGKLFVLDGIDGCGKTTTTDILDSKLSERYGSERVVSFHMPGSTALGREIKRLVRSSKPNISPFTERLLFAADERQTIDEIARPAIESGKIVLSGRWASFTDYAYGLARGLTEEEIDKIHKITPVPMVDRLFVFCLPFDVVMQRKKAILGCPSEKHDRFETLPGSNCSNIMVNEEYLKKVHEFYEHNCQTDDHYVRGCSKRALRADGTLPPKELAQQIFEIMVQMIE
jgi:dTMP kinase